MKGYKGFNKDLICRDFQYEIGRTYEMDEPIEICARGFHFCENLKDCFNFYKPSDGSRYCEIESYGDTIESDTKIVTAKIKIVRELSPIEINRTIYGSGYGYGYGYGYGSGYGYGDGSGYGYGDGYGYKQGLFRFEEESA